MRIEPFELERSQCLWEHVVEINLAESGVHPMTLGELISEDQVASFRATRLGYSQTNGTIELRDRISALYLGATRDHVLVTHGTCEANFLSVWSLIEPGDEVVLMLPNYLQIAGLARAFGAVVRPFHLRFENGVWSPDLDGLQGALSPRTRLVAVCNPNNPTGAVLSQAEMQAIAEAARSAGAWLLADEVYQGAERNGVTTPSFWGMYDKVLITNGLSKAYGAPGLRIGWIAGPAEKIASLWGYHDYSAITVSTLSDLLARAVLARRDEVLGRTRRILRENFPILEDWMARHTKWFTLPPTAAGAMGYPRYNLPVNSTDLTTRLRERKSVLIVPGDHFGMDHYLRINYGAPREHLIMGLDRLAEVMAEM